MTASHEDQGVELRFFGGPSAVGPNGPIRLSPSQLALLTLVFAEGGITRRRVATILWREEDTGRIRHRIRQLLHQVNTRIGVRAIDTEGDGLVPNGAVPSDMARFRSFLRSHRLLDAAKLVEQAFAPLPLPMVRGEYRDWAESLGQRLERQLTQHAVARWEECVHGGLWTDARDAAEALYVLRPHDSGVVLKVIQARAQAGRIGSAEAAYATYIESLPAEESPDPEVQDLIERTRQIRKDDRHSESTSGPFVGREDALAAGRLALDRVEAGEFAVYLASGESGIGKTRLLAELHRAAVLRDFRCLRASPVELERRIPLNPLLDAFKEIDLRPHLKALGKPWSTVISSTLPAGSYDELAGELPAIQESSLPRRLLDAFSMLLEQLSLERPTVLFLDDLQWADATTVAALQFFQRRWKKGAFGIIASVRPDLIEPGDPASKYLDGQDGLEVARIELGELTEAEAARLINGIAKGAIEAASVGRLCEFAGLHPLYLTELTRDFLSGRLKLPDLPVDEVLIPVSLEQILRSRIDRLSDQAHRIAGLLAVGARAMRLGDVAALAGIALDDCTDCVDELERGRLVAVRRDTVQISHDLFRSAIYKHLSEARRAVFHRAIADHLLLDGGEVGPGELAIHFDRAGEADLAAQYGWAAAARAWENGAMAEAAFFYEVVTENETDPGKRAEGTAGLGRSLHLCRNLGRANPALELAAARLRETDRPDLARRMDIHRVDGLAVIGDASLGDVIQRLESIKAEARTDLDWEAVALALNVGLGVLHERGDMSSMPPLFAEMSQTAGCGSPEASTICYAGLAVQALFGDAKKGLDFARRAVSIAPPDGEHRLTALLRLLVVLQAQGALFLDEGQAATAEARLLAERSGDLRLRISLEGNIALNLLDAGETDRAEAHMNQIDALLGSADLDLPRFNHAVNRAELALVRCDFEDAARRYSTAMGLVGGSGPAYVRDLLSAGSGLCALESGRLSEARRREQDLGEPPQPWHYDPTTIVAFRARLLERRSARRAAIELLETSTLDVIDRHVMAWFKLNAILTRLLIKEGRSDALKSAEAGHNRAVELRLPRRAEEFSALAERARNCRR